MQKCKYLHFLHFNSCHVSNYNVYGRSIKTSKVIVPTSAVQNIMALPVQFHFVTLHDPATAGDSTCMTMIFFGEYDKQWIWSYNFLGFCLSTFILEYILCYFLHIDCDLV